MSGFDVTVLREGSSATLRVAGELGPESLEAFETVVAELDDRTTTVVVLDLAGLTYLDSTGPKAARLVEERFHRVVIRNAPPLARRIFEITALDHLLDGPP